MYIVYCVQRDNLQLTDHTKYVFMKKKKHVPIAPTYVKHRLKYFPVLFTNWLLRFYKKSKFLIFKHKVFEKLDT